MLAGLAAYHGMCTKDGNHRRALHQSQVGPHDQDSPGGVASQAARRQSQTEDAWLVGPDMACSDGKLSAHLLREPLWRVLLMLSASDTAVRQLRDHHACSLEEARLLAELNNMRDDLCGLHVEVSEKRAYGCLLITNLRALRAAVQDAMRRLEELRSSR